MLWNGEGGEQHALTGLILPFVDPHLGLVVFMLVHHMHLWLFQISSGCNDKLFRF